MQNLAGNEVPESINHLKLSNVVSKSEYPTEIQATISVDAYDKVLIHEFEGSKIIIASGNMDSNITFLRKARELPASGHIGGKFTSFGR